MSFHINPRLAELGGGFFRTNKAEPGETPQPQLAEGLLRDLAGRGVAYPGTRLLPKMPDRYDAVYDEKVRSGPSRLILPVFLPYLDNYSRETQEMRRTYRYIGYADAYCSSAIKDIIYGVSNLELTVKPAKTTRLEKEHNKEVADFVQWQLGDGMRDGRQGFIDRILYPGLVDGYSINEPVLEPVESGKWTGKIRCAALKTKDTGADVVLQLDDFRNIVGLLGLRYNAGRQFSPGGFLIYTNNSAYDLPTGTSELRAAYSPWWYKDTVEKLRSIFLQLLARPIPYARYQSGTAESLVESVKSQLANLLKNAYFVLPETVLLDVLNVAGGAQAAYDKAISDYKHDIYQAITGQTLANLEGLVEDARGNSAVHQSVRQIRVEQKAASIVSLLNDCGNGFVKNMVDLNYVVSAYPTVSIAGVDVDELQAQLALDTGLKNLQYDLDDEEVQERYGRKLTKAAGPAPAAAVPPFNPEHATDIPKPAGAVAPHAENVDLYTQPLRKEFVRALAEGPEPPAEPPA
jgi:hypothetical protein